MKNFKDNLFKRAMEAGFSDCEIYCVSSSVFEVRVSGGEIQEQKNAFERGLSFRGTYNGNVGYSYTEKVDESVIDRLVSSAKQNSEILEDEKEILFSGKATYNKMSVSSTADLSAQEKIKTAIELEQIALKKDTRIKQVIESVVADEETEIYIANTHGLDLKENHTVALAYLYLSAEDNGQSKVGFEFYAGKDFEELNTQILAEKTVEQAVSLLGASSLKSGKYPVIFNNKCAADLLSTFSSIFYAENVQRGYSLLNDKLEQRIAGNVVTIRDDCQHKLSAAVRTFDSEGVNVRDKAVVENGILKTYLYNMKSAAKDSINSTGNGFRPSFKASVGTAPVNFYISPSDNTQDQLFKQMEEGLYITSLAGLHSGANSISGDFSFSASGYYIEKGSIVRPVEQITVAGNFYTLLKKIVNTGNDLVFDYPGQRGTFGSPCIFVEDLSIAGI